MVWKKTHALQLGWVVAALITTLPLFSPDTHARTQITPEISVSESFVKNKTATLDESGQITEITPGISIDYTQARLDLALGYRINAVLNSGLEAENHENQTLDLLTQISHQPNHWVTRINAQIEQTNTSPDGIQIVNNINESSNSEELRAIELSTNYQNRLSKDVDYLAGLSLDFADIENREDSDSVGFNLGINNSRTQGKISWNAAIISRRFDSDIATSQDDDNIDTIQAGLNYRINQKFSTFLSVDKSDTSNELLNDTNTTIGLLWIPNTSSSIKIGAGVRGDDETWLVDSIITSRRVRLALSYEEKVTTSSELVFDGIDLDSGLLTTSQSLSNTPQLLKRGTITLTVTGRRTEFSLAYFDESENRADTNSTEEQTEGLTISGRRTLSRLSYALLSITHQESEATQQNTIEDIEVSYNRELSQQLSFSAEFRVTEQTSNVVANEYQQEILGLSLSAKF